MVVAKNYSSVTVFISKLKKILFKLAYNLFLISLLVFYVKPEQFYVNKWPK